jgi:hypothetical protein
MKIGGFDVVWDYPAQHDFYRLSMHSATMADRAVTRFVERGEGEVLDETPYLHVRAGLYNVVLIVTPSVRMVTVLRIHRARA